MKPLEYLCLAILIAVMNMIPGKWYLDVLTYALSAMWLIGSLRLFRKQQEMVGE